ncbi:MAG: tetratricopeptide repeat protein, partial [Hyphomicrobium sp.]
AKAKAISLGYNSASSWEMLGDMLVGLGKFRDAADAFKSAIDIDPNLLDLRLKLDNAVARNQDAPSPANAARARDDADLFGPDFLSAEPLPAAWRHVSIVTIQPEGNPHTAAFSDLTTSFEHALRSLGIEVERRSNVPSTTGINLLFGAHLIGSQELADRIPANTIIINLEQISGFDVQGRPTYLSLLRRLPVWDYSHRNIEGLRRLTKNPYIRHFSVGYVPEMTRSLRSTEQTTDVLFYGSLNPRREAVLNSLKEAGLNVRHLFSVYGEARDQAIAAAKVVLNVHFYEDSIHEIIRTSYLLANGKAVVSECGPATEIDDDMRQAMIAVPYAGLVASCITLVRDGARRAALERRAFEIFSKRDQAKILRETIEATILPASH